MKDCKKQFPLRIIAVLLAALLLFAPGVPFFTVPVLADVEEQGNEGQGVPGIREEVPAPGDVFRVLEFSAEADETDSSVSVRFILKNTSREAGSAEFALPATAPGIKAGTLEGTWYIARPAEAEKDPSSGDPDETGEEPADVPEGTVSAAYMRIAHGPLTGGEGEDAAAGFSLEGTMAAAELPAGAVLVLEYRCETDTALRNARTAGVDLSQFDWAGGGSIGRVFYSLKLREEDIPLVYRVFPVNYRFEDRTVSVELFEVRPSRLLDRIYIAKDTYRDLKSSREYEPNAEQLFVLAQHKEWFEHGLGITDIAPFADAFWYFNASVFETLAGNGGSEDDLSFYMLRENTDACERVFSYLVWRDLVWPALKTGEMDGDTVLNMVSDLPLLARDEVNEAFSGPAPSVYSVLYAPEESLADALLYARSYEWVDGSEEIVFTRCDELSVIKAVGEGMYNIYNYPRADLYAIRADLMPDGDYSTEELQAYLDAIGSQVLVKQVILDNRYGAYNSYMDQYGYMKPGYFSAGWGGTYTAYDLQQAINRYEDEWYVTQVQVLYREDPQLDALEIPAFIQYWGIATIDWESRHVVVSDLIYGNYTSYRFGVTDYHLMTEETKGQRLLEARDARVFAGRAAVLAEIKAARNAVPDVLRVLDYRLEIDEAESVITASMLLVNGGAAPFGELSLPMISNDRAKGSLRVQVDGQEAAADTDTVTLNVPAGGSCTVTYTYRTKVSLRHAGVIGFDLRQLVPEEGGRIGRFTLDVKLAEEDIPLVNDIFPANYVFDGETVNLTLYDFAPSALLSGVYLSKDTYRGLKAGWEFEPNECQSYILSHYREWFRNGLPFEYGSFNEAESLFVRYLQEHIAAERLWWDDFTKNTDVYRRILFYIVQRDMPVTEELTTISDTSLSLLTRELVPWHRGEPHHVYAVLFEREPSLAGERLYTSRYEEFEEDGRIWAENIYTAAEEMEILQTVPDKGWLTHYLTMAAHMGVSGIRPLLIPDGVTYTAEELKAFVDVIGVEVLQKQKILDNRDGAYSGEPGMSETGSGPMLVLALPGLSGGELAAMTEAVRSIHANPDNLVIMNRTDAALRSLGIPAFTRYWGYVTERDGMTLVTDYMYGSYASSYCGFIQFGRLTGADYGEALLSARDAERAARIEQVLAEIEAYEGR
ncbi:MAG: hypothetical protein J6Z23_06470 [Lachnospiraceae bacterium]|nr:hypothetical protein [Lachnospiraceae bacterium]